MRRFQLAPDGPEVSAIAYGVWRLGDDPKGTSTAVRSRKNRRLPWSPESRPSTMRTFTDCTPAKDCSEQQHSRSRPNFEIRWKS